MISRDFFIFFFAFLSVSVQARPAPPPNPNWLSDIIGPPKSPFSEDYKHLPPTLPPTPDSVTPPPHLPWPPTQLDRVKASPPLKSGPWLWGPKGYPVTIPGTPPTSPPRLPPNIHSGNPNWLSDLIGPPKSFFSEDSDSEDSEHLPPTLPPTPHSVTPPPRLPWPPNKLDLVKASPLPQALESGPWSWAGWRDEGYPVEYYN